MTVFDHREFDNHEQVVFCRDAGAGLSAVIAVHSTALGPACGGCRMYPYRTTDDALNDALRLSRAMSYKNAMAGLPLGGGKAVVIGDPKVDKRPELLRAFARHVQMLGGRYRTAEDVGISLADVRIMGEVCTYTFGFSADPGPYTARGVYEGMRAAVHFKLGRGSMAGLKVAVQGIGSVGRHLCELLFAAGADLYVADVRPEAVAYAVEHFDATPVEPALIHTLEVDVFAPCAMGGVINDETLRDLKALVVAGAANNQLAEPRHGKMLRDLGILYAPDYVVNAGGMLSASRDILHEFTEEQLLARIGEIYFTTQEIFDLARAEKLPTHEVADHIARQRIAAAHTYQFDMSHSNA